MIKFRSEMIVFQVYCLPFLGEKQIATGVLPILSYFIPMMAPQKKGGSFPTNRCDRLALKALQSEPGLLTALLGGTALLGCKNHGRNSWFLERK